jgi:Ca2+-binding RTX toxin-like protein
VKTHPIKKLAAGLAASFALATPAIAADLELTAGVLTYSAIPVSPGAANQLTITLAAGTYAIDDPTEPITLGAAALAAGCAPLDADTVTCPAAALASFAINTRLGNDRIVLTGSAHPAVVTAGDGDDTVIGGNAADTIVWSPGDDNDTVDGGGGDDTLLFNGSNAAEAYTIVREGSGFALQRNVAAVTMHAQGIETLRLLTVGGSDVITTQPLAATRQEMVDTGTDVVTDTLVLDTVGDCAFRRNGDELHVVGFEPVRFSGFEGVGEINAVCGGVLELQGSTLIYVASPLAANALEVTRDDDVYVLHDGGEPALTLSPEALTVGCERVDAITAACPVAALTSFDLRTADGADSIDLTGLDAPATVRGGFDADTIVGGDAGDTFLWFPGDGSDVIGGGLGADTVSFLGSAIGEIFTIAPDGTGFTIARNIGSVVLTANDVEVLDLSTIGGADTVTTTVLAHTRQQLKSGTDAEPDTLTIDARGLCLETQPDQVTAPGREPVVFLHFANVALPNEFCAFDPCVGAVATTGCTVNGAKNQPCLGTDGNDVIAGTPGTDVILGGGGRDRIKGGDGADVVCGEAGDDVLLGGDDGDFVVGGPGEDRLKGDAGNDHVLGGDDDDRLDGGKGDDEVHGGLGADGVKGGADDDLVRGDDGRDTIDGGRGGDVCPDTDQAGPFRGCEL